MAKAAQRRLEATVHPPAGVKRQIILHQRPVEELDRVAVGIGDEHHLQHLTGLGFGWGADAHRHAGGSQRLGHGAKLQHAGQPQAQVDQIVRAVRHQLDAVVPIIHTEVGNVAALAGHNLHAEHGAGKLHPVVKIADTQRDGAQFCDAGEPCAHVKLPWPPTTLCGRRYS